MTRMLVRAANAEDAFAAAAGGVDVLDVRMPGPAPHRAVIRAIRAAFPGTLRLHLEGPLRQPGVIDAAVSLGADEIAVAHTLVGEARAILGSLSATHVRLVAAVPANDGVLAGLEEILGVADAVLLDTPPGERLMNAITMAGLDAFARACRLAMLPFGLAGGLESPDVARLLVLQPDLLGFDAAARRDHRRELGLEAGAIEALRALIPRDDGPALPHRDEAGATGETDHIFVHDFVVLLAIGAYQAERGVRQRVRFSVDADVRRPPEPPRDMRGVFSYDIIVETIRVLAERPHVTFVETLAEELAASLLAYSQLMAVTIKVEKLDVIDGSVGIVVKRTRANLGRLP